MIPCQGSQFRRPLLLPLLVQQFDWTKQQVEVQRWVGLVYSSLQGLPVAPPGLIPVSLCQGNVPQDLQRDGDAPTPTYRRGLYCPVSALFLVAGEGLAMVLFGLLVLTQGQRDIAEVLVQPPHTAHTRPTATKSAWLCS